MTKTIPTVLSTSQPERAEIDDVPRAEFEIVRTASRMFEDASNAWMERAMKAEAALAATPAVGGEAIINCVRFVKWALQEGAWSGGDLDGGGIQDKAESLGLIIPVPYDPEKHGAYNDYGCDAGDPWFEFSPGLNAAAPPASLLLADDPTTSEVEKVRQIAFGLSAHQQYRLAFLISENIGYALKSNDPLAELSVDGHPLADRGDVA